MKHAGNVHLRNLSEPDRVVGEPKFFGWAQWLVPNTCHNINVLLICTTGKQILCKVRP
jgi:hypothetical protein